MISLPAGFDPALLISDFFTLAAPFIEISFIVACGFLIVNVLKRA